MAQIIHIEKVMVGERKGDNLGCVEFIGPVGD